MNIIKGVILHLVLMSILQALPGRAAEPGEAAQKVWKLSAGGGLIVAPAFTGARNYSLLAVPDLRVAYGELFFANVRDGIGYAVVSSDGWRIGPIASYAFVRSEKDGGSVFRIAGSGNNALQGMGDVPGTVSLGGFVEYSLKPYKLQLHLHKGITGHKGLVAEGRASYGGKMKFAGPPLIYSFGPHIKFGDRAYINAYWGVTPEQSARSGLEQYHPGAGITAYGVNCFALTPLTKSVSVSIIAGYDRLAPPVAGSPLVRTRGAANQGFGGVFVSYDF